jgi:hypothetical protein
MRRIVIRMAVAVTLALGLAVMPGHFRSGQVIAEQATFSVAIGQVAPDDAGQLAMAAAPALAPAQLEALQIRKLQMREQMAALADNTVQPDAAGLALVAGRATETSSADEAQFPGNPASFIIGRNRTRGRQQFPSRLRGRQLQSRGGLDQRRPDMGGRTASGGTGCGADSLL